MGSYAASLLSGPKPVTPSQIMSSFVDLRVVVYPKFLVVLGELIGRKDIDIEFPDEPQEQLLYFGLGQI